MSEFRNLRQYQCVFPYGVGALWNYDRQCFVAADLRLWRSEQCTRVEEPRLIKLLGCEEFWAPPIRSENRPDLGVPFVRFPRWHFCPNTSCRKMSFFNPKEETEERPICQSCGTKMIHMRFMVACSKGHLADIDWDYWIHQESTDHRKGDRDLVFEEDPNVLTAGGISALRVRCNICNASKNLGKIFDAKLKCSGQHPWVWGHENCDESVRVCQVGVSNLRFEHYVEALSIPPFADFENETNPLMVKVREHPLFHELSRPVDLSDFDTELKIDDIAEDLKSTHKDIENAITSLEIEQSINSVSSQPVSESDIMKEEYLAITSPDRTKFHPKDRFQKRSVNLKLNYIGEYEVILSKISRVVIVDRLRMVRVLRGFSRLAYDEENMISAHPGGKSLPAVELFGEGIFIELHPKALEEWASRPSVKTRCEGMGDPEFALLHSFSHALILQFQYRVGYPASSIRERIYWNPKAKKSPMNGILLFTAFADAYGGMGGLAKMASLEYLLPLIRDAVERAENCSNDPVCSEKKTNKESKNAAACYSCLHIPETSCTEMNQSLDRLLISGNEINPKTGFFT